MLNIVSGDLVDMAKNGVFDVIFHGCNCFHTMGGGIARQIKREFPQAYEADLNTLHADPNKIGTVSVAQTSGGLQIVNCYTQYKFGTTQKHFIESALQVILDKTVLILNESKPPTRLHYGFPLIGCGLAGGDSEVVTEMLTKFAERVAEYATVTLVLYEES